jgi:hypothetical protein
MRVRASIWHGPIGDPLRSWHNHVRGICIGGPMRMALARAHEVPSSAKIVEDLIAQTLDG